MGELEEDLEALQERVLAIERTIGARKPRDVVIGAARLSYDKIALVVNERGDDIDFRVEGSTVTDLLKVDAGKDVVYFSGIGARVYNSAALTIGDASYTTLTFDSERFDTDTIHSTSSNTGRLTATTAGIYLISVTAAWASDPSNGAVKFC